MKKIPTLFLRSEREHMLTATPNFTCVWVIHGQGIATRKYDGTCVLITESGDYYKRRELKPGQADPKGFVEVEHDAVTGKTVGWVPVDPTAPEDRWHRKAHARLLSTSLPKPGTYELVGPKINGNAETFEVHQLIKHEAGPVEVGYAQGLPDCPRTFEGLRTFLATHDIEGIVWHHPDGRMAKIKAKDFGLKRHSAPDTDPAITFARSMEQGYE